MIIVTRSYPVYSPFFWKAYAVQMRPYLLFVSGIAGAAGMAMGIGDNTNDWKIVVAFLPFFLGYGFGQALTDCFQTDTDKLSAPYRPLSKGIVSIKAVFGVSILGLLLCAMAFYSLNFTSFLLSGLAVFGLASYSYVKKNITLAGPFYNAWIVTLLPVMGYFALSDASSTNSLSLNWHVLVVSLFSYASFVLIGYLKDIEADRATGYKTFPVIYGWKNTVLLGDLFALASISFFWLPMRHNSYAILVGIAASLVIIYGQLKGHVAVDEKESSALQPILATVRSFVLFHIALVLHYQPTWWPVTIIYYLLFEWFLYRRPSKYQV